MKIFAAVLVGSTIGGLMGFIVIVMIDTRMDLYSPIMGCALVLAVLLAIGATEWFLVPRPRRDNDLPPKGKLP